MHCFILQLQDGQFDLEKADERLKVTHNRVVLKRPLMKMMS